MSERRVFIVLFIIALGLVLACRQEEEPPATESSTPAAIDGEVRIDTPGPIVDLDPDSGKPEVFAWYRTPAAGQKGFPKKTPLVYKGSVLESMDPDTHECDFREDFIGGKKIETFTVWDEDQGQMSDGKKVLLQSRTKEGDLKIEIVIEKDVAGNKLNWVVDDKTDRFPSCTLTGVKVEEGKEGLIPVEFKDLERELFREISGDPRVATDFKFWVWYESEPEQQASTP